MYKLVSLEEKLKELSPESLARVNTRYEELRAEIEGRSQEHPKPRKQPIRKPPGFKP